MPSQKSVPKCLWIPIESIGIFSVKDGRFLFYEWRDGIIKLQL